MLLEKEETVTLPTPSKGVEFPPYLQKDPALITTSRPYTAFPSLSKPRQDGEEEMEEE